MVNSQEHTIRLPIIDPATFFSRRPVAPKFQEHRVTWSARRVLFPPMDDREKPDHYAGVAEWRCEFPLACQFWHRYVLNVVSLRDIKGVKPAVKHFAEATHELTLFAVDPQTPEADWQSDRGKWRHLTPVNHCVQFTVRYDQAAVWVGERCAEALVSGRVVIEPAGVRGAREQFTACVREWEYQAGEVFKAHRDRKPPQPPKIEEPPEDFDPEANP